MDVISVWVRLGLGSLDVISVWIRLGLVSLDVISFWVRLGFWMSLVSVGAAGVIKGLC